MIIYDDIEQGTEEWLSMRCGIPTASEFSKIITGTGKPSSQSGDYMNLLLGEWLTGRSASKWSGNKHSERGHELEPEARVWYEMMTDFSVKQVGFLARDDGLCGCSPDGLVGDDGALEIKNRETWIYVPILEKGLTGIPTADIPQCQGVLYIAERDWIDYVPYCPGMPGIIVRAYRDDAFIKRLQQELGSFIHKMLERRELLKAKGYTREAT